MTYVRPKLIGLSLSLCVIDLVHRRIAYSQVIKIVAGTAAKNDEVWDELIKEYQKDYWSAWYRQPRTEWPKLTRKAIRLAERLRAEGKIEQPRLTTGLAPSRYGPKELWVRNESQIKWW